jgi:hypothetical protein
MNSNRWRFLVGGVLVVVGLLALLGTMFSVSLGGFIWAVLFIAGGLVFIYFLATDRKSWWAAIPGFTLLGIGTLIGLEQIAPRVTDVVGGALVLGGIGISFIVVYLMNRSFWWAIIPAGVMTSLVLLILMEPLLGGDVAWIFLFGLALTFGVVYLMPGTSGERMTWALYPAGVLALVAAVAMIASVAWAAYVFPVLLILGGIVLVLRAARKS